MGEQPKYLIVETQLLPDVYLRVVEANRLLQSGKARTVNEAVEQVGLSRSAFYKYRDGVKPFLEMTTDRIVTFHLFLRDEPGLLSAVLSEFAQSGANILTINQSIPINDQAAVTISAKTDGMHASLEELMRRIEQIDGILKFEILASE